MKISRKWRRAWNRGKPAFLKRIFQARIVQRRQYKKQNTRAAAKAVAMQKLLHPAVAAGMAMVMLIGNPLSAQAMPTDGKVTAGQGSIAQNGSTMTVTQNTDKLAINWQSFNIAQNEKVQFIQPGAQSVALNRIIGNNASQIYGQLSANGKVFLINTNGILFSPTARVETGSLVASTLNLSDSDFMAGNYRFTKGSTVGSVINQGQIVVTDGGYIALLGEKAVNEGVIIANKGSVALGAGEQVTLDMTGDGLINLAVNQAALKAQVENKNLIQADGGMVVMTARAAGDLAGTVVNNSGVVRAQTLGERNGKIVLEGGTKGVIVNSGTLDVSGTKAGANGGSVTVTTSDMVVDNGITDVSGTNGGTVSVNAGHLFQSGTVKADGSNKGGTVDIKTGKIIQTASAKLSANGNNEGGSVKLQASDTLLSSALLSATGKSGGQIDVLGKGITLLAATADATGSSQGGQIHIGGDSQGIGTRQQADTVFVNSFTSLDVSAEDTGNGGQAIVWSKDNTNFYGAIKAKGGALGGNGGFMEVSGKNRYAFAGKAEASAVNGTAGRLLLDPKNVIIDDVTTTQPSTDIIGPSGSGAFGLTVAVLVNGNIVVTDPNYSAGSNANAGAAYLYNGGTGAVISAVTGSNANDQVGYGGVVKLSNSGVETGNFVVSSDPWNGGFGAGTWGSGSTGFIGGGGIISATNSMIGDVANDHIGNIITNLNNGNYLLSSMYWHNGKGAATWGNGTSGGVGTVSASNSLVGSTVGDGVGNNITRLQNNANSSVVVSSSNWDNNTVTDAGFAALINGANGKLADGTNGGTVSAANALVGTNANDKVSYGGVCALTNGNYVVNSDEWNSVRGAVTWGSGVTGATGAVTPGNSLTGTTPGEEIGMGWTANITALSNGNYVVGSSKWNSLKGAATWVNGSNGYICGSSSPGGTISSTNSLVGQSSGDSVGWTISGLNNGNYVVCSPYAKNGSILGAGAVTWGNGSTGTNGIVDATNSLVGVKQYEQVGYGSVFNLKNGNYVVNDLYWNSSNTSGDSHMADTAFGKVIWMDGTNGNIAGLNAKNGTTAAASGLTGSVSGDQVGSGRIGILDNGNYVVLSDKWDNSRGAATWVNGTNGNVGNSSSPAAVITSANSLVGSTAGDKVSSTGIVQLTGKHNYVVVSKEWNSGAGAVTWIDGANGNIAGSTSPGGTVGVSNSLLGSQAGDNVGANSGNANVFALSNGNYVVGSAGWNSSAGALTLVKGTDGTLVNGSGPGAYVTSSNSLVGTAGDYVGGWIIPLANGNFLSYNYGWNNSMGSITWGDGTNGTIGSISAVNSYLGAVTANYGMNMDYDNVHNRVVIGVPDSNKVSLWSPGDSGGGSATTLADVAAFSNHSSSDLTIDRGAITAALNAGTNVTIQANTDITVNKDVVSTAAGTGGNLIMQAGRAINVNANITTANGNLSLVANDNTANIADRDSGAGSITLASGKTINAGTGSVNMSVGTAGTAGDVTLTGNLSAGAVSIAGKGATTIGGGISATNDITVRGNGTIMLQTGSSVTSTGGNIILDGGNSGSFINNSGAAALQVSSGKSWRVYSASPLTDTRGGLAYNFKQYNGVYDSAIQGTGNGFIYSIAPSLTVNLTGTTKKTYDGDSSATLSSSNYQFTGGIDGDSVNINYPSSGTYTAYGVGTSKEVTANGITLAGASNGSAAVYGYSLSNSSASGNIGSIDPKKITYSVANANGTYGTLTTPGNYSLSGVIAADSEKVAGTVSIYDNSNHEIALGNKTNAGSYTEKVTSLTGTAAGNYEIDSLGNTNGTLKISPKAITITPDSNKTMVYNGSVPNAANLTYSGNSGLVSGDSFTGVLALDNASKNVGSYAITPGTLAINDGNSGGNYAVTFVPNVQYVITPKALTINGISVANKTYDGKTAASMSGTPSLTGIVGSDDVSVDGSQVVATFADPNAGTGKSISISGLTLTGAEKNNYTLSGSSSATANIDPKKITYNVANANGTYGTQATPGNYSLSGVIAADSEKVAGTVSIYDNSNHEIALGNKTNAGSYTEKVTALTGTAAGNYEIDSLGNTNGTLKISPKAITITPDSSQTMVYNGSVPNAANLNYSGNSGLVSGDSFTGVLALDNASKNVGSYAITPGTLAINDGNSGGNYAVTFVPNVQYVITPKALTINGISVANKTYDGKTTASMSGTPSLTGIVGSDDVSVDGSQVVATFADPNAGTGKSISISGLTLTGAEKDNYTLSGSSSATANIDPKKITYNVANANGTYGTQATPGNYSLSGVIAADSEKVAGTVSIYDNSNHEIALGNKTNAGSYTEKVTALTGTAAGNYEIDSLGNTNGTLKISPKAITITPDSSQTMVYNGSVPNAANLTYSDNSGLVSGDSFTGVLVLDNASKNVGSYAITPGTLAINDGNSGGNYAVTFVPNVQYVITPKALTITGTTAADKPYDGTLAANLTIGTVSGLVGSETVGVSGVGMFGGKNAGANQTVTAMYTLADGTKGGLAGNYSLPNTTTTASITPKALTITGTTAADKPYDGTLAANLTLGTVSGLVGSEAIGVSANGTFASKNAGANQTVTAQYTLTDGTNGSLASNYSLADTKTVATINKKALTLHATAANKIYDGIETATVTGYGLSGFVGSETVVASSTGAEFSDKNAGADKVVTIRGVNIADGANGGLAANYSVVDTTTTKADIRKKAVTVSGITAQDKNFDSNTTAILNTANAGLSGTVAGDNVSLITANSSGSFDTAMVGTDKVVKVTGLELAGSDGLNYELNPYSTTANIKENQQSEAEAAKNAAVKNTQPVVTQPADTTTGSATTPIVQTEQGGLNVGTRSTQTTPPANTPASRTATESAGPKLVSASSQNQSYTLAINDTSVTLALSGEATSTAGSAAAAATSESAKNIAVLAVDGQGSPAVVDRYNIVSTGSSLTVTTAGAAGSAQINADIFKEESAGNARTETFKLTKSDGTTAEFSVTYMNGAISIKPLNVHAVELSEDEGADMKVLVATGMITVQDKLGVQVADINAVYIHK